MSTSLRDQVILLTASALFMASSPEVAVRPTVYIATTSELYAAVNDSANSGAVVVLAPGSYVLDPSQPNGGRLELQPDMALEGVHGNSEAHDDSEAVVIDASALPATSYQIGPFLTGAIRMGRGVNAIKWLTVQAATNGAAAIETDLPSMIASVRIAHVILQGASAVSMFAISDLARQAAYSWLYLKTIFFATIGSVREWASDLSMQTAQITRPSARRSEVTTR